MFNRCCCYRRRTADRGDSALAVKTEETPQHQIIPGVEHSFFEEELDRMEHQQSANDNVDGIVILAVDSSNHSDFAFEYYVKEVHRSSYMLHVVHCSEAWAAVHSLDGGPNPHKVKEMQQKESKKVEELQQKYTKLMADSNVKGQFKVLGGKEPWHQIIRYQEQIGAFLIVVGTRGANAIRRTLVGSVSDSIVHHAKCPVLVCRKN